MDFSLSAIFVFVLVACCAVMLILDSSEKDKKIKKLEYEAEQRKDEEYKRRFEQIYALKYEDAYNNQKNKMRWENWVESCKNGKIHWSPSYDEYISDGWFSDTQSPGNDGHISIFDDKHFEQSK